MSADKLLTAAQELAAQDGVRASVLAYMDAVDALVAEKQVAQAQSVMIDLLKAQEKKKGLFGRVDKNPLGSERVTVGLKFAEVAPLGRPTEDALDQLGYLAQDFPGELTIRRANADALRQSGYAADAIDEYRHCAGALPDDAEVNQHIADLYVGIGRPDDAAGYLMHALELYGKQGDFAQLAAHAESLIELRPASIGDIIDLLSTAPGESLVGHLKMLDELAHRVTHAGILDSAQRAKAREQLQALYERLGLIDRGNDGVARGLETLKSAATPVERRGPQPESPEPVAAAAIVPPTDPVPPAVETNEAVSHSSPPPPPRRSPAPPNALAAFTRRKAKELFEAGDLQGAAMAYERLLRSGSDMESLEGALTCYIGLARAQDAARVAVELINEKDYAGDFEGALQTLDRISEASTDVDFAQRRAELLVALGRPEPVSR